MITQHDTNAYRANSYRSSNHPTFPPTDHPIAPLYQPIQYIQDASSNQHALAPSTILQVHYRTLFCIHPSSFCLCVSSST